MARGVVDENSPELEPEERAKVAEIVGIGAVKYADQTPWQEKQRQSDLEAAGYWVVRCTWEELIHRPHEVIKRIALALLRAR